MKIIIDNNLWHSHVKAAYGLSIDCGDGDRLAIEPLHGNDKWFIVLGASCLRLRPLAAGDVCESLFGATVEPGGIVPVAAAPMEDNA